jgi:hypothetical protein
MRSRHLRLCVPVLGGSLLVLLALVPAPGAAQVHTAEDVALAERACQQGKGEACFALAAILVAGKGVPEDLPRAASVAQRGCQLGEARACRMQQQLAKIQDTQKKQDASLAELQKNLAPLLEECEQGMAASCVAAGFYSTFGADEKTGEARMNQYLDKACALDPVLACKFAKEHHGQIPPELQQKMDARRFVLRTCEKACDAKGGLLACNTLAGLFREGKFAPRDEARAFAVESKACEAGYTQICANVGIAYTRGEVTPVDMPRAIRILTQACKGGGSLSCRTLGLIHAQGVGGTQQDLEQALSWFQQGCQLKDKGSCAQEQELIRQGVSAPPALAGDGGTKNPKLDSLRLKDSTLR